MSDPRLRVGIDITPLLGPPTGIPAVTRGMLAALADRDDIVLSGWMLSGRGTPPELPTGVDCFHHRLPAAFVHRAWKRVTVPPGPWITGRVDVVHGTNYVVPPGRPSVVTLQDLSPIAHPEWTGRSIARMGKVLQRAVRMGAVVHVPCRRVADEARDLLDVDDTHLRVVHNAVDQITGGDASAGRLMADADRFVLALGTTGRRKALPTLVAAMASLPDDVVLVVAGPVGDAEADLAEAVDRHQLDQRFRRLTVIAPAQRDNLLSAATLLAFPSLYEGYGLPPLEAITAGVAVVATDVGALGELIGAEIPLVPPGDPDAFAESLRSAWSHPATPSQRLRSRLSELTWDAAAAGLVDAYRLAAR